MKTTDFANRKIDYKVFFTWLMFVSSTVFSQPVISSFSPASGTVGTSVTINGSGFSTVAANNIVYFGSVKAQVSTATATSLTVVVPAGSTVQPITVTTAGLTAYSTVPFIATYPGGSSIDLFSFAPKNDISSGGEPGNSFISDLDGDGKPDIAVINHPTTGVVFDSISLFRNISVSNNISFDYRKTLAVKSYPSSISVADLDGDGKPDIAALTDNTVSIFKNNSTPGTFAFATRIDYAVNSGSANIAINDIDGDGKPDLAIVGTGYNNFSLLRNTTTGGNISFASKVDFAIPGGSYSIATGDLNNDQKPDVAVVCYITGTVSVFRNTSTLGNFSFAARADYSTGSIPRNVNMVDLNGDAKPELITSNTGSGSLSVLKNNSSAGLITFSSTTNYSLGKGPVFTSAGDINGDGYVDLVTANINDASVSVLQNDGTGILSWKADFATQTSPYSVMVADFNADGKPDIAAANNRSSTVSLIRNRIGEPNVCNGNLSATVTTTKAPCAGYNTQGSAVINATGGTGTLQYSLNGTFYQESNRFSVSPGIYAARVKDAEGCIFMVNFTVEKAPSPIVVSSVVTNVSCTGTKGSVLLSATGGTQPYFYSLKGDSAYQSSNIFSNLSAGTYHLWVTDSVGCTKDTSFVVGQANAPNLVVSNPAPACYNSGVDLTAPALKTGSDSALSYTYWRDTLATVTLTNPTAVTTADTYFIKAANSGGCFTIKPVTVSIISYPDTPRVTANGPLNICNGSSVTLTSSSAANYQWYKDGVQITGAASQSYVATQSGSYRIYTTNSCGNNASVPVTVLVSSTPVSLTVPQIFPSADTTVCEGNTVSLRFKKEQGVQYTWLKNGQPLTYGVYDSILTTSQAGSYAVRAYNTCNGDSVTSASVTIGVTPYSRPRITAGGPLSFCNGGSVTLTSTPAASYQWLRNWVAIPGATAQTYTATQSGYYYNQVTNPCGNGYDSVLVTVSATPATLTVPVIRAAGDTNICSGSSVWLRTTKVTGLRYQWFINNSAVSGGGISDTAFEAKTTGVYTVRAYNTCNGDSVTSAPINVRMIPYVAPAITASGPVSLCNGQNVVLTSSPASAYQWYRNWVLITGATSQTYTATQSGYYYNLVTLPCGLTSYDSVLVTVSNTPAIMSTPAIHNSGDTTFCTGSNVLLYTSSVTGVTYKWLRNGIAINGANDTAYKAQTSGIYAVRLYNNCNNDSVVSRGIMVSVIAYPDTPRVTASGPLNICNGRSVVLTSSTAANYQWYKDGILIPGATSQTYTATKAGSYRIYTQNNCGTNASLPAVVSLVANAKIDTITASPSVLWSPDHKMVDIYIAYGASDTCATSNCDVYISSNEPQNGLGDGDMDNDWEVVDNYHVRLRAERSGNDNGRIYTIKLLCKDSTGKSTEKTTTVTVPKNPLSISVLQNPSTTEFKLIVNSVDNNPVTVRVFKSNGNLIETRNNVLPNSTITLGKGYERGLYYVELTNGNTNKSVKIIKL